MLKVLNTSGLNQLSGMIFRNLKLTYKFTRYQHDSNQPLFDMTNPYEKEKKRCILCTLNVIPNYKNVQLLSQFQSSYTGRIYGRHITGLCTQKQKEVEAEIVKAQSIGLMGYYNKNVKFVRDPKLFDPDHPLRPHRF